METFNWRKSTEEKPMYHKFGHSLEVVGVDRYRFRSLYKYIRGEWYLSTDYTVAVNEPPILWHYLPQRPSIQDIYELNNTTTCV